MVKHQSQHGRVKWACWRGLEEPNPPRGTKNSGANGGRNWRAQVYVACSDRRRELNIATHNVRTMAVDGKHGVGRAAEVLGVYL